MMPTATESTTRGLEDAMSTTVRVSTPPVGPLPMLATMAKSPVGLISMPTGRRFATTERPVSRTSVPLTERMASLWVSVHVTYTVEPSGVNAGMLGPQALSCRETLPAEARSEEHTSELQSRLHLVC